MTLMEIDDFDYELPTNLIAQHPPKVRGDSKLLIVNPNKNSNIDSHCKNFYDYLSPNDLLIFNDTKVIKARLFGEKATGGKVELLIENIISSNHALAMIRTSNNLTWNNFSLSSITSKKMDLVINIFRPICIFFEVLIIASA